MKPLLACLAILLSGCAGTRFYDRSSGKLIASFQGDMSGSEYSDGHTHWKVATVSHSAATIAQGTATGQVIDSVGNLGLKVGTAFATSGAIKLIHP